MGRLFIAVIQVRHGGGLGRVGVVQVMSGQVWDLVKCCILRRKFYHSLKKNNTKQRKANLLLRISVSSVQNAIFFPEYLVYFISLTLLNW